MKIAITYFLPILLISSACFSQTRSKLGLGSAESVLNDVLQQHTRALSEYSIKNSLGEQIQIEITNYYYEDGWLSMTGKAKDAKNSVFILKGDKTSLYGYTVIHDTKVAYEYTTNSNGQVIAEEVPIAKIVPDLYEDFPEPLAGQNAPQEIQALTYSPMALGQAPHIGKYNNQDLLKLESKPGSKYVFYLDIHAIMNGGTPKYVTPEQMYINWQCASDQYSMYDVNVTTNLAVYNAAGIPNSGIAGYLDEDGRSNADLNSFGTADASRLYRDAAAPWGYGLGRTVAHEGGHQMGLSHDGGQPGGEYYEGIPAYQWCPIMGNYWFGNAWNQALYQWSKGEYSGSSNKEDDLSLIKKHVPFTADDIPTTKPLNIGAAGEVSPKDNFGQINSNTDTDVFTFEIAGSTGHIKLKLDPIEFIRMLDIDAKITNASGTTIAQSNLPVDRSASFDVDLPAGTYKLEIKGGAEGTPQNGFSNYSSMGFYAMEGTITGTATGISSNNFTGLSLEVNPNPSNGIIRLTFNSSISDNFIVEVKSMLGQLVYREDIANFSGKYSQEVDLKKYGRGLYFVSLTNSRSQTVKRIINQ